jgi:hypothetical protein
VATVATALALLPVLARAQTRPVAAPPAVEAAAAAPLPRWEYGFALGAGWDHNVDFLVPDGPSAAAVLPRGGIARVFSGPRGSLRASAAGGYTRYPREPGLDRHHVEGALQGTWRSSPATTWRGSVLVASGRTDASAILVEQGVALPLVRTRAASASADVRHAGPRSALRAEARYQRAEFDAPGLLDGDSLRATLGAEKSLGGRHTAALEYAAEAVRSSEQARPYLTHFASLQWTHLLSPRTSLLLEAGASYTPEAARAGLDRRESFHGGVSLGRQDRSTSLLLFLRREVTPAFGLGRSRPSFRGGLAGTVPLGRSWELRVTASHVRPDASADPRFAASDDVFLALIRRLGRRVELSAETRYRHRAASAAAPAVQSASVGVFLTVATPQGRPLASAVPR